MNGVCQNQCNYSFYNNSGFCLYIICPANSNLVNGTKCCDVSTPYLNDSNVCVASCGNFYFPNTTTDLCDSILFWNYFKIAWIFAKFVQIQ